jgi:hypothetical protein
MSESRTGKVSSFKHSGDLGDIIFSLPAIRALGGGVLFLDPEGGRGSPLMAGSAAGRTKLNREGIQGISPVLLAQGYVKEVRLWAGEAVDYDLDRFREHEELKNLSDAHLAALGLPLTERDRAWLTIRDPIVMKDRPLVISRSVRYHGNHTFWERLVPAIKEQCVFVGFAKEHEMFEYTFGHKVMYYPTPDLLTLARVIAGCRKFIGNAALPHALAEGMKKDLVNEVYRAFPHTLFVRPGAEYV